MSAIRNAINRGDNKAVMKLLDNNQGLTKTDEKFKKIYMDLLNSPAKDLIKPQIDEFQKYFNQKEKEFKKTLNANLFYTACQNNIKIDNLTKLYNISNINHNYIHKYNYDTILHPLIDSNNYSYENSNEENNEKYNDLIIKIIEADINILKYSNKNEYVDTVFTQLVNGFDSFKKSIKYILTREETYQIIINNPLNFINGIDDSMIKDNTFNDLTIKLIKSGKIDIFNIYDNNNDDDDDYEDTILISACKAKNSEVALAILECENSHINIAYRCNNRTALSIAKSNKMTDVINAIKAIYDKHGIDKVTKIPIEEQIDCIVCYEKITAIGSNITKECCNGHGFHIKCIEQWWQISSSNKNKCALCRCTSWK